LPRLQHRSDGWWFSVDSQMIISATIQSAGVAIPMSIVAEMY